MFLILTNTNHSLAIFVQRNVKIWKKSTSKKIENKIVFLFTISLIYIYLFY